MPAVVKMPWTLSFFHGVSAHSEWCVQHSLAAAVQSFISSTAMSQQPRDKMNSTDYSRKFTESYIIVKMSCKSAILKKL